HRRAFVLEPPGAWRVRRRVYTGDQVDAVAAYCSDRGKSYLLPAELFSGTTQIFLRLEPSRTNQSARIHRARDYEFGARLTSHGPIAQLGERRAGSAKAGGSSPPGSIGWTGPVPPGVF